MRQYLGRHPIFHAVMAGLWLAVIMLGPGTKPTQANDKQWHISASTKAEVLLPGSTWKPLSADTVLVAGAEVKVGPGGRAVLKKNGDVVILSPNSHMKLPATVKASGPSILQKLGTLLFKIRKREQPLLHNVKATGGTNRPFKVDTPYLAAVIKGTVFSINVSAQGSALHVTSGLVEAISQATGERGLVHPGQTARVSSIPGAGLSISHGGKTKGKSQGKSEGKSDGTSESRDGGAGKKDDSAKSKGPSAKAGKGPSTKASAAPGTNAAKGRRTAKSGKSNGRLGLRFTISNGVLNVTKTTKGLLKSVNATGGRSLGLRTSAQSGNPGRSNASQGNPGKGNSGNSNPGGGVAGLGNAGLGNPGGGNNGNGNPGGGNAGGGNPGGGNAGGGNAGGNPGGGNAGGGNPGGGNAGGGNPGGGNPGGGNAGNGNNGNGNGNNGNGNGNG